MGSGHRSPQSNEKTYVDAHLRIHWGSSWWLKSKQGSRSWMQWHHCIHCTIDHGFMNLNASAYDMGCFSTVATSRYGSVQVEATLSCTLFFPHKAASSYPSHACGCTSIFIAWHAHLWTVHCASCNRAPRINILNLCFCHFFSFCSFLIFFSLCCSSFFLVYFVFSFSFKSCWSSQHYGWVFLILSVLWLKLTMLVNVNHWPTPLLGLMKLEDVMGACQYCPYCYWRFLNMPVTAAIVETAQFWFCFLCSLGLSLLICHRPQKSLYPSCTIISLFYCGWIQSYVWRSSQFSVSVLKCTPYRASVASQWLFSQCLYKRKIRSGF